MDKIAFLITAPWQDKYAADRRITAYALEIEDLGMYRYATVDEQHDPDDPIIIEVLRADVDLSADTEDYTFTVVAENSEGKSEPHEEKLYI